MASKEELPKYLIRRLLDTIKNDPLASGALKSLIVENIIAFSRESLGIELAGNDLDSLEKEMLEKAEKNPLLFIAVTYAVPKSEKMIAGNVGPLTRELFRTQSQALMGELFRKKVIISPIEEELKRSYLDYAMSVIIGRAIPDARDGLKPVHRRILFAMYTMGLLPGRPHKKCATVIGEVLGKYHPHGDMAVYDALVRMAQDFILRYPLIDGQGNFGSIDGDNAAAYRYTEARISPIGELMLHDISKDCVDFIPNFDNSTREPIVLPAKIPNLLINGASGIAVGMATSIPPHNLGEVIDAICAIIDNPDIKDLTQYIKGPDFPTGGRIIGSDGLAQIYKKGTGRLIIEGNIKTVEKKDKKMLCITEIPYQVNKANLVAQIENLVKEGKLLGIACLLYTSPSPRD